MIGLGGAARVHAERLCEKLGVDRCLVPQGAGVGSAIGFLRAPFSFEANRSVFMKLSTFEPYLVAGLFAELEEEATKFVRSCDAEADIRAEHKVYMRYSGQGWEIPVPLTPQLASAPNADAFEALFEQEYANLFGRTVDGMEIEITVWSVNATTPSMPSERVSDVPDLPVPISIGTRVLFDPAEGTQMTVPVYDRRAFDPGRQADGPSIITEDETTIVVTSSRRATALADGCIDLRRKTKDPFHA